jgi:hypothetical protein
MFIETHKVTTCIRRTYPIEVIDEILYQAYNCQQHYDRGGMSISKLENITNPMISRGVYLTMIMQHGEDDL